MEEPPDPERDTALDAVWAAAREIEAPPELWPQIEAAAVDRATPARWLRAAVVIVSSTLYFAVAVGVAELRNAESGPVGAVAHLEHAASFYGTGELEAGEREPLESRPELRLLSAVRKVGNR